MSGFVTKEEPLPSTVKLIHGDCLDVLRKMKDKSVDAVVTDPPYGISMAKRGTLGSDRLAKVRDYGKSDWDDQPMSREVTKQIRRVAKWQVIFGGNFFELPPTSCWFVWDKMNSGDYADCELAWTNLTCAVRKVSYRWNGMIKDGDDIQIHPTQKPVEVMQWCLRKLPKDVKTVMDPFMGSGTTGVACAWLGLDFIGVEKDERYFQMAKKRIQLAPRAKR